jgi:6-pyruvoyltetrahydropterin/6-carboxytetrahydropterin synthase
MMPMFEVEVQSEFAAAHQLKLPDGSFEPMHGHNWPVTVEVEGPDTDAMGCLVDFHAIKAALDEVLSPLHNSNLNDHAELADENPSAEHVARFIARQLAGRLGKGVSLKRVTVGEAPGCRASFRP